MAVLHPSTSFDQVMATLPDGEQAILVRTGETICAFRNRCPHLGINLDWGDGRCLREPGILVCSMHGALFAADSGRCLAGPCAGDALEPVAIRVVDGRIETA